MLAAIADLRPRLRGQVYGVLGNHDPTRMLLGLERLHIRMLMNESEIIDRDGQHIHLAGIDDAHFYRADNIEKAAAGIPSDAFSILLSHTPEIYQPAALADFNLLLSGHTHGGQVWLPLLGRRVVPSRFGQRYVYGHVIENGRHLFVTSGIGTSVLPVRFMVPPEIALLTLR